MANKKEKSNVEYLRDILKELSLSDSAKATEAEEFLDAIVEEYDGNEKIKDQMQDLKYELREKKERIEELEDEVEKLEEDPKYDNTENLGLDTLHWKLETGNILIEQHLEEWIKTMKVRYGMLPSLD